MKLNIIKILNQIASEEASVNLLNNPCAFWNNNNDLHDLYEDEMNDIDMINEQSFDMCDWLISHGKSYDNVKFYDKPSYNKWLENMNNYMVYKMAA